MGVLAIAGVNLRRMVRYRPNLFFMLLFPMLLILVIGAAFGGDFTPRLGVVVEVASGPSDSEARGQETADIAGPAEPGPLADRLVTALAEEAGLRVDRVGNEGDLRTAVERGELAAGLVVPAGYDERVSAGERVDLRYLARPDESGQQLRIAVGAVVSEQAAVLRAARFTARETGGSFDAGLDAVDAVGPGVAPLAVRTSTVGEELFPESLGRFDLGASSQLLLFVFLTSLTASAAVIESRRLGIARRTLAAPVGVATIVAGEALGRLGIALVQGLIIMLGAGLLFGVDWGDPLGAAALLLTFALVASGAAMVIGAALRTEQQASGIGIMLGLGLAALGGSMVPIEIFSGTMQTVARFTPHAWANEGFAELVRRDGGLADIAPQLGVLVGFAVGLFVVGGWLMRRTLYAPPG
jgi:ABC-2 type transport system permease protein